MAERSLRSTVNTLFIGSIPINAFSSKLHKNITIKRADFQYNINFFISKFINFKKVKINHISSVNPFTDMI